MGVISFYNFSNNFFFKSSITSRSSLWELHHCITSQIICLRNNFFENGAYRHSGKRTDPKAGSAFVPEKIFIDIGRKKNIWSYFSLFRVYQIDHISKTKNRRSFLLFFPFYSAPSASSIKSERFRIIHKK